MNSTSGRGAMAAITAAVSAAGVITAPRATAVPGPEVEYTYNVVVRRHFTFPGSGCHRIRFPAVRQGVSRRAVCRRDVRCQTGRVPK